MRKFFLLLTTVIFIFSKSTIAQSTNKQKVSFGIKSGVNVSRLNLSGNSADRVTSNFRTGFVAGAFVHIPIKKFPISIQPEFLYSSMGGDLSTELKEKKNFRFNYFSIPVLIKYQFSKKFVAFAGPQLDAILYAEESNKLGEFDITGSVEEIDAHITGGLEYWIGKDIMLSGRYMYGFYEVHTMAPGISMINRGFQFTIESWISIHNRTKIP
ncbi:MAG: PorT family protein [Bacteroidetes bacterium]|nr:MAG: PorT family protein [Bacteroidota bacterium]